MIRRLAVLFLLGVSAASAQEVMAPKVITTSDAAPHVTGSAPTGQGSMWVDSGGSSPLEKDFAARFFVEQGVVVRTFAGFDVGAYVNTTDSMDQHSLDWNRFARGSAGMKLVKTFNNRYVGGLIRGDMGYTAEHRFVSGATAAAPSFDINYWIGWQPQQGSIARQQLGHRGAEHQPDRTTQHVVQRFREAGRRGVEGQGSRDEPAEAGADCVRASDGRKRHAGLRLEQLRARRRRSGNHGADRALHV